MSDQGDDWAWQLPHDRAAEQVTLGAMMVAAPAISEAAAVLAGSGDFYLPAHQIVYETVMALHDEGAPAGPVAVSDRLAAGGLLGKVGGGPYLHTLIASVPTAASAGYYAQIVRDRSTERQMIEAGGRIIRAAHAHGEDLPGKVDAAYRVLDEAAGLTATPGARPLADLLPAALDAIEAGPGERGVLTGWEDLDALTGGMRAGQMITIASRPAVGKSVVLLNIAANAALAGIPVLACSLEMSRQECIELILAAAAGVTRTRLRDGTLRDEDWDLLGKVNGALTDAPLLVNDEGYLRVSDVRADLRAMRRAGTPARLVVIDYLQLMTGAGRNENRQTEVSGISRGIKLLAKEFGVPVVLGAQLNRGPEVRSNHRPLLADLRESGSIEMDSDAVILLYREDVYGADAATTGEIELNLAKNRHGPTGLVTLGFAGHYGRVRAVGWSPSGSAGPQDPVVASDLAGQDARDELAARRRQDRGSGPPF